MNMRLERGSVVSTTHPDYAVCFTRPLREWYVDLVDT